MFAPSPTTDKICDTLEARSRLLQQGNVTSDHILRLANLLISVCPTEEVALELAKEMPVEYEDSGIMLPLKYGQFRFDCDKLAWVIL